MRALLSLALLAALPGCAARQPAVAPGVSAVPDEAPGWRSVATADDRDRLRDWRSTFVSALRAARSAGHGADIDREGVLLQPDAALAGPAIPDGLYRCRTMKIGARSAGLLNFIAYPYFRCRVATDGGVQTLTKLTGSQRQVGTLYADSGMRQVFLGTLALGDESRAIRYGSDRERNVAAWLERIGPERWRLVMPRPHFESQLDILDLVPEPQTGR